MDSGEKIPEIKLKFQTKIANTESCDLPNYLTSSAYRSNSISQPISSPNPQKKYFPEQSYGISYESPTYFRAKHTLVNKNSYRNPYLTNPEDYDFSHFVQENNDIKSPQKSPSHFENKKKLRDTQTFKIGEDVRGNEKKIFKSTKLPSLTTYKYFFLLIDIKQFIFNQLYNR